MDSLEVLRAYPRLVWFPVAGGLAGTAYLGLLIGGWAVISPEAGPSIYGVLFIGYLGSTFIAAFFTAGLTASVRDAFAGHEPSFRDGVVAAWKRRRLLLAWAIIAATVGVVLRILERQHGMGGRSAAGLFGVAWGILTYFVIPVIVFEDVTVRSMLRRSGDTFRRTWGETIGSGFGVGLITTLFMVLGIVLAVAIFVVFGGSVLGLAGGILIAVLVLLAAYLLGTALGGIAKTALYVYATTGTRPAAFDDVEFDRPV